MKTLINLTGSAGEYFVCSELCKHNLVPLLTPKNNPLFDIMVTNPSGSQSVSIQVKTMGLDNKQGWKLSKQVIEKQNNPALFIVLVNLNKDQTNDFYVFRYDDVVEKVIAVYEKYINQPKQNSEQKKEVGFRWLDLKDLTNEDKARKNDWSLIVDEFHKNEKYL